MNTRPWPDAVIAGIGEAMLEMAPVDGGFYAAGFAGDTLNTCWYLKQLLGDSGRVEYVTKVGTDSLSRQLLDFLAVSGIGTNGVSRDAERTLGLYLIQLDGAERHFSYWRSQSAARRLAEDPDALDAALLGAGLIHISGITLAIVEGQGRRNLFAALERARARGSLIAFDPNVRRRLWPDAAVLRAAMAEMFAGCDIALPSFEDEAGIWGDGSPEATAQRIAALGAKEIAVKNGAAPAFVFASGATASVPAGVVHDARDTTGAGDAFNAGYLAARHRGVAPRAACGFAHVLGSEVIRHAGALAPVAALEPVRQETRSPT